MSNLDNAFDYLVKPGWDANAIQLLRSWKHYLILPSNIMPTDIGLWCDDNLRHKWSIEWLEPLYVLFLEEDNDFIHAKMRWSE